MDLVVGVLGNIVSNPPGKERPLCGVTGEIVILNIFLACDQHLELQLQELVPEGEHSLLLRYQLVGHHLPLYGALVLVVLGVPVLLYIPHRVDLVDVPVGDHLVLHEAPVRVLLPTELKGSGGVHMDQPDLGVDGVPDLPCCVPVDDVHLP